MPGDFFLYQFLQADNTVGWNTLGSPLTDGRGRYLKIACDFGFGGVVKDGIKSCFIHDYKYKRGLSFNQVESC